MAWLIGCVGCGKTNVTLRKIDNGPRICNPCLNALSKNKQLPLHNGSGKMILRGNQVSFVPAVKSDKITIEPPIEVESKEEQ